MRAPRSRGAPDEETMAHKESAGLRIDEDLLDFVNLEALSGTGIGASQFWTGLARIVTDLAPRMRAQLRFRDELQEKIDAYHRAHSGAPFDVGAYEAFLRDIGYIVPAPADFTISTANIDPEIGAVPAPQLVVPASSARILVKAANARWGSLYDALYGSDVIPETEGAERGKDRNKVRAAVVIDWARGFLDDTVPLGSGSYRSAKGFAIESGALAVALESGETVGLEDPSRLVGYQGRPAQPSSILLRHNGLHIEIKLDRRHPVGRDDPAGIADIVLESALSAIVDLEDMVVAVDAQDKIALYRNWLGLMKVNLTARFDKDGRYVDRMLAGDRRYILPAKGELNLPGRALLLMRNVGHHLVTDAVLDSAGEPIPETILDCAVTSLIAMHDLKKAKDPRNSRHGSVYIVKPKLHGPDEVALADALFGRVEDMLRLPRTTLKMGIMDEERRTSVNLAACIKAAEHRVFFINTGFLDRTGDEIHTSMEAGPMIRKKDMKSCTWIAAYENANVSTGLACGLPGKAQIGKGMWAAPDKMADMLAQKIVHPLAGASTAWAPSPTAATLHAVHYHKVDVKKRQAGLTRRSQPPLSELLSIPTCHGEFTPEAIRQELDTNCHTILGYLVRWIDAGVGCSRVPDIEDVELIEDRATLRISSQHLANWLRHKIVTEDEVMEALRRMAELVDRQNAGTTAYRSMAPAFDGLAFGAATTLVLEGGAQPNGTVEAILFPLRREAKAAQKPQVTNRFEALTGQTAGLERGEAFRTED
jgi:malate synthase